jgi:hypothetical protein
MKSWFLDEARITRKYLCRCANLHQCVSVYQL